MVGFFTNKPSRAGQVVHDLIRVVKSGINQLGSVPNGPCRAASLESLFCLLTSTSVGYCSSETPPVAGILIGSSSAVRVGDLSRHQGGISVTSLVVQMV